MAQPLAILWDMDGTLIDSEPYWHASEKYLADTYGGEWTEEIGWQLSGTALSNCAKVLQAHGMPLTEEQIGKGMTDYTYQRELEHVPWTAGVHELLVALADAGIPSVLVTTSPRHMVRNIVAQAPEGAFIGYVCGSDPVPHKPSPAPYRLGARMVRAWLDAGSPRYGSVDEVLTGEGLLADAGALGDDGTVEHGDLARFLVGGVELSECIAFEDSISGLTSAAASGAYTAAVTGYSRADISKGPQRRKIKDFTGLTPADLASWLD